MSLCISTSVADVLLVQSKVFFTPSPSRKLSDVRLRGGVDRRQTMRPLQTRGRRIPCCECRVEGDQSKTCISARVVLTISSLRFSSVSRAATN